MTCKSTKVIFKIGHLPILHTPYSVTLDDLERRNSRKRILISPISVGFGVDYVKVVKDTPILSAAEM